MNHFDGALDERTLGRNRTEERGSHVEGSHRYRCWRDLPQRDASGLFTDERAHPAMYAASIIAPPRRCRYCQSHGAAHDI
jgi:hypothetical protein